MGNFLSKVVKHDEVKRGASHLLVGVLIGVVSTLLFGASTNNNP